MIGMDSNHCQIIKQSIAGARDVDEQTLASLAILSERLERVRKLDKVFGNVKFSPAVRKLSKRRNAVAVG